MSAQGMLLTVLATQIAEAVAKDETPEVGGCDISAGMFGPNLSAILRDVARQLDDRANLLHELRNAVDMLQALGARDAATDGMRAAIAKARGGAA